MSSSRRAFCVNKRDLLALGIHIDIMFLTETVIVSSSSRASLSAIKRQQASSGPDARIYRWPKHAGREFSGSYVKTGTKEERYGTR
jgi:hypothetical protein